MGHAASCQVECDEALTFTAADARQIVGDAAFSAELFAAHATADGVVSAKTLRSLIAKAQQQQQSEEDPPQQHQPIGLQRPPLSWHAAYDDSKEGAPTGGLPGVLPGMNPEQLLDRVAEFIASAARGQGIALTAHPPVFPCARVGHFLRTLQKSLRCEYM